MCASSTYGILLLVDVISTKNLMHLPLYLHSYALASSPYLHYFLFQKPHGIMPLLDEESNFPQSSDYTLVHKLKTYCSENERFIPALGDSVSFGIRHYAEQVRVLTEKPDLEVIKRFYNHATSNLAIYSHETSQDKLSEA